MTALHLAGSPSPRVIVHALEPSGPRANRLREAAASAGAAERLVVHADGTSVAALGSGSTPESGSAMKYVVRIGDAARTAELLAPLVDDGALDIAAVVWSTARPSDIAGALQVLADHGFWLGTISLQDGEVTLDPLVDHATAQTVIAIEPPFLTALGGDLSPHVRDDVSRSASSIVAPPTSWIAFDWEVRADTGWGIYGLNLATQLALRGDPAPLVLACDESTLPPLVRHGLADTLAASAGASAALCDPGAIVHVDGTLLRAFGNGFVGA